MGNKGEGILESPTMSSKAAMPGVTIHNMANCGLITREIVID